MINLNTMTVLIVDDMLMMCKSIHKMMQVIGYGKKFFYAGNGKEALGVLKKEAVDLVLLDHNMPVMEGSELLSRIRADRELRYIPVLMITAQAYAEYVAEAAESDIDAYILKPLTIKLLDEKVTHVVDRANNPPLMVQHLKQARDFEEEGDLEAAIEEVEAAIDADPQSSRPIREMGYYHYKKGKGNKL